MSTENRNHKFGANFNIPLFSQPPAILFIYSKKNIISFTNHLQTITDSII